MCHIYIHTHPTQLKQVDLCVSSLLSHMHIRMCCVGESYAGIYVPMLTREVVKGNTRGVKPRINIKVSQGVPNPRPAVVDGCCSWQRALLACAAAIRT
jgi:hypothetical protein